MSATVLYMSMSLDGFIAGPNARMGNGLGDGGERLHEWSFNGQFSRSPPICSTRGRINIFERWESQAARETFRQQRP